MCIRGVACTTFAPSVASRLCDRGGAGCGRFGRRTDQGAVEDSLRPGLGTQNLPVTPPAVGDVGSGPLRSAVTEVLRLEEAPSEGQRWRSSRMASLYARTSTSSVWRCRGRRACEPTRVD